jgi:hypothetical protein
MAEYASDDDEDFKRAIALSLQDANTNNDSTENMDAVDSSDTEAETIDDSKAGLSSERLP